MVRRALGDTQLEAEAGHMPRLRAEEGQTIVEYGLVIGGISLVLISVAVVGGLDGAFTTLVENIEAAFS
jgi:Flp pilus assembly pilin Flp